MMSPNKTKKGAVTIRDSSPEAGPSCSKRPRSKMSSDDDDEIVHKKAAPSKYGSNYIRSPGFTAHNKPAELFRKDLISAMKLADSEPLQEGSYFLISDPWRQEWEKGVQVPVNLTEIMQVVVKEICEKSKTGDFKMPHKMLHERVDSVYRKGQHELTGMQQLAEQLVRYDLDDLDVSWLEEVNFRRREMGLMQIDEWNMECVMEALENQCHEKMSATMKTEEGMGIEYDEDVVCDVCRSPESEDTNEMVFCDGCDVCIHQACYGIQSIPEGSWLCRTCALGIKPQCLLCPKAGGAMKSTKSGTKWAHVSCALWIPEVSIGIPEKMEPITKISNIPASRWSLVCCLCKERVGACIQCSVKTCKTAFHVTCGFSNNLEMKTVLDESDERDGVKLKAYCPKHTKKRERGHSESDTDSPHKDSPSTVKKELTQQERDNLRLKKLKNLEEEFYSAVDLPELCQSLQLDEEIVDMIFVYWKLKRKCNWDKPLLTPKTEEADILEKQQEDSLVARMKMFVHLRQDLERVRNLCYMIGKREKMKRHFFRAKEYVFTSMVRVLLDKSLNLSEADVDDIVHNYHFNSVYDDYGRSVQNLPPELSHDEDDATDLGEKEGEKAFAADGEEGGESVAEEADGDEDNRLSQVLLPPGERWSGEFVRSGFFHRRRHKKWMKNTGIGKVRKLKSKLITSSPLASASVVKHPKVEAEDDSVFFASADESEDEKHPAVMKLEMVRHYRDKTREAGFTSQPPIPKLVVKSQRGNHLAFHLRRHKKRHKGRKPWHVKKSHNYDLLPKLNLSSGEDDDDTLSPIVETGEIGSVEKVDLSEENVTVDVEGDISVSEESVPKSASLTVKSNGAKISSASLKTESRKTKSDDLKTASGCILNHVSKSDETTNSECSKINFNRDCVHQDSAEENSNSVKTNSDSAHINSVGVENHCVHAKTNSDIGRANHRLKTKRSNIKSKTVSAKAKPLTMKLKSGNTNAKPYTTETVDSTNTKSYQTENKLASARSKFDTTKIKSDTAELKLETVKVKLNVKAKPEHFESKLDTANVGDSTSAENVDKVKQEKERDLHTSHLSSPASQRTARRDCRKASQNIFTTKLSDPKKAASTNMRVDDMHSPDTGKEVVCSSKLGRSRKQERSKNKSGKFKSKIKVEEAKEMKAMSPLREMPDRHGKSHRSEGGERSNIFESFERHCREGSYVLEDVSEPSTLPESSDYHLSTDWHCNLKDLVGDAAGPTRSSESPVRQNWLSGVRNKHSSLSRDGGKGLGCSYQLSSERMKTDNTSAVPDPFSSPDNTDEKSGLSPVKTSEPSNLNWSSEPHQKRKCQIEDDSSASNTLQSADRRGGRRSSSLGAAVLETVGHELPERHRRKSSHEARLRLNKVLTARDDSSDDDFELPKSVAVTCSQRKRRDRLHKNASLTQHIKNAVSSDETSDDEMVKEKSKRRVHRQARQREQSKQNSSPEKSTPSTRTGCLRPELSKLLKPSDLVVENVLINRVENSFLRRYKCDKHQSFYNGVMHRKRRKIDSFLAKQSNRKLESIVDEKMASKNRVLNEISPEKSGNFQNHIFGAHYSPRGSLSGYKIPKKNNSQSAAAEAPSGCLHNTPSAGRLFGSGAEFHSFRSVATADLPHLRQRAEGPTTEKLRNKLNGGSDVETASVISSEHCEANQFSMDHCRGYRSQSPSSEASTAPVLHSDSRESTPRRVTRSQLTDDMVENSLSQHTEGGGSVNKMKLRDGMLKSSHFSS